MVLKPAQQLGDAALENTFTARAAEDGLARVALPMAGLQGRGLFELRLTPHTGERETRLFARNAPASEGRLQTLSQTSLRAALPEELRAHVTVVRGESEPLTLTAGGSEIWRFLALALLATMVLESVLAWRFGRR